MLLPFSGGSTSNENAVLLLFFICSITFMYVVYTALLSHHKVNILLPYIATYFFHLQGERMDTPEDCLYFLPWHFRMLGNRDGCFAPSRSEYGLAIEN